MGSSLEAIPSIDMAQRFVLVLDGSCNDSDYAILSRVIRISDLITFRDLDNHGVCPKLPPILLK